MIFKIASYDPFNANNTRKAYHAVELQKKDQICWLS